MNNPYVICHMMASIDGRIDCAMTEQIEGNSYYEALEALNLDATIEGKVTALMHYAEKGAFDNGDSPAVEADEFYKSHDSNHWEAVVETRGSLLWPEGDTPDRLCIVSQQTSRAYLDYLRERGISYIVTGRDYVDLAHAIAMMHSEFGAERIGVVGGGHINGSFLAQGLLDEVSIIFGPAIDGREGFCAAFDGIETNHEHPYKLHLKSVRQMDDNCVWLRYQC
jgi:riboflavin biosynthesis pyrimidine reductase